MEGVHKYKLIPFLLIACLFIGCNRKLINNGDIITRDFSENQKENMTVVEFDQKLKEIDFSDGTNVERLDDYLLACLAQLEIYKHKEPSYDLFLLMFDQARNGPKVDFDLSWKDLYSAGNRLPEYEWNDLTEWERVIYELRFLTTDLINTREIRSQPDYEGREMLYEWDTEGGVTFYNGTTPESILIYAATRFEKEYPPAAYQETKITWERFTNPLWIGISYE